jgi:hypothetical protein
MINSYPAKLDLIFANLFILIGLICLPTAMIVGGFLGYKIYVGAGIFGGIGFLIQSDKVLD